ncbi:MAG: hypothetical protein IJ881_09525 [Neisseriaceae bacterium]|nr:hypothetical protein [Neisseriaceae bacterium]
MATIAFWASVISGFILLFLSSFFNMLIKDDLFISSYRKEQNKKCFQYAFGCFIVAISLFFTAIGIFAFRSGNIFNSLGLTGITEYAPLLKFTTVVLVIVAFSAVMTIFDNVMSYLGWRIISLSVGAISIMSGIAYAIYWFNEKYGLPDFSFLQWCGIAVVFVSMLIALKIVVEFDYR